jgi:ubiquitin carboxyl-terminal hydrolase L3
MNTYIQKMGVNTSKLQFCEVLSLEDWALEMVPRPCAAVLMVFPIKDASEAYKAEQAAKIATEGQIVSPNLRYIKQTIGNACGTIGILHALSNVSGSSESLLDIKSGSYLSKYLSQTASMTGEQIAEYLDADDELESTHEAAAAGGSTAVPEDNTSINTHFVCFVHRDGHIYEMDGRKAGPINHGECEEGKLLEESCKIIQGFMDRDPGELSFSITALTAPGAF